MMIDKLRAVIDPALPLWSNLANASAVLASIGNVNWCGFYVSRDRVLYVGPFQGEPACTRIPFGRGVCGTAAARRETVVVRDVHLFPGHIACSAVSQSEIVVPIIREGEVVAVIDVDAPVKDRFGEEEKSALEQAARLLAPLFEGKGDREW